MKNKNNKNLAKFICIALAIPLAFMGITLLLQDVYAHKDGYFIPDYKRVNLTENTDYKTIFEQTGLGKSAIDKLKNEGDFERIFEYQEYLFNPPDTSCNNMLFPFTKEERMVDDFVDFVDLQPGDILISLSTHSMGWRHGHAGIVIDKNGVLESEVIGTKSKINALSHFTTYGNFAQLRLKNITPEKQKEIATFCKDSLTDIPYGLTAGYFGDKAPDLDSKNLRVHCSYLVWYAYNYFGYDIDSDGGRLVTSHDILHSEELEIVQIFGMNPKEFIK